MSGCGLFTLTKPYLHNQAVDPTGSAGHCLPTSVAAVQLLSHIQLCDPHRLQHTKLPYSSLFPGVCSNSYPLSQWCHPTISRSATLFSFCLQSFPASGSFPVSRLFASDANLYYSQIHPMYRKQWLEWKDLDAEENAVHCSPVLYKVKLMWGQHARWQIWTSTQAPGQWYSFFSNCKFKVIGRAHDQHPRSLSRPCSVPGNYLWNAQWQRFNLQRWCWARELKTPEFLADLLFWWACQVIGLLTAFWHGLGHGGQQKPAPPRHRRESCRCPMTKGQIPTPQQLSYEGNTSAPSAVFLAQGQRASEWRAQGGCNALQCTGPSASFCLLSSQPRGMPERLPRQPQVPLWQFTKALWLHQEWKEGQWQMGQSMNWGGQARRKEPLGWITTRGVRAVLSRMPGRLAKQLTHPLTSLPAVVVWSLSCVWFFETP